MIKKYCDSCEKEIPGNEEHLVIELTFIEKSGMSGYENKRIYCQPCFVPIKKILTAARR